MGKDSPIKYIVLQVHYATVDKFKGKDILLNHRTMGWWCQTFINYETHKDLKNFFAATWKHGHTNNKINFMEAIIFNVRVKDSPINKIFYSSIQDSRTFRRMDHSNLPAFLISYLKMRH